MSAQDDRQAAGIADKPVGELEQQHLVMGNPLAVTGEGQTLSDNPRIIVAGGD